MKKVVEEWIERGNHDLEVAKLLFSKKDYFDVVLFHIHQAVEKFLKGYLICRDKRKAQQLEEGATVATVMKNSPKDGILDWIF